jgi:hypothetical protein
VNQNLTYLVERIRRQLNVQLKIDFPIDVRQRILISRAVGAWVFDRLIQVGDSLRRPHGRLAKRCFLHSGMAGRRTQLKWLKRHSKLMTKRKPWVQLWYKALTAALSLKPTSLARFALMAAHTRIMIQGQFKRQQQLRAILKRQRDPYNEFSQLAAAIIIITQRLSA